MTLSTTPDFQLTDSGFRSVRARWISKLMLGVCALCTLVIIALLVTISGYLLYLGLSSLNVAIFSQLPTGDPNNPGGLLHAIVGTAALVALASLIGIPVGSLAGIYLAEYAGQSMLAAPVRFISDVLAGVPSIVVGILGYELLVVPLGGYNGWAGALALAFIMVPIVARTTEEMLLLVPNSYREASIALGSTKAGTIMRIIIPAARGSLVTGIMLAIARVAGETAPLLFTALGSRLLPFFHRPGPYFHGSDINSAFPSLTVQIYDYATRPDLGFNRVAWGGIVILLVLIFALNLGIRYTTRERRA